MGTLTDNLNLLYLAAYNNHASAIQVLLDYRVNIEHWDPRGLTPLYQAIRSKALEAATALVNSGADVIADAWMFAILKNYKYLTPIASI